VYVLDVGRGHKEPVAARGQSGGQYAVEVFIVQDKFDHE
jgi:hypothetical protein